MKRDLGYRVRLSQEGLRRAVADNAMKVESCKRQERIARLARDVALAIALGMVIGWGAVNFGGMVS